MAKIKTLSLSNYQGVVALDIDFAGVNATIYGRNGTGKSTVANAIAWLLYDKAADGAKNYTPKTHGVNGHLHNLDHSAEMTIIMDSGTELTLKRVYHEVYTKKRGTNNEEFTGHVTDHFVDGVPTTEKEYKLRVTEICQPDMAKILTQPQYFAESMTKDDRRRILIDICGNVSDMDVIDATPEIVDLPEILRKPGASGDIYTVDEYRRIADAQKKEINKELSTIRPRIDEVKRMMPEAAIVDNEIDIKIEAKRNQIEEQNSILAEIKAPASNNEADSAIRAQIADIDARISEARAKYAQRANDAVAAYNSQVNDIHTRVSSLKLDLVEVNQEKRQKLNNLENMYQDLDRTKQKRVRLLSEYNETSAIQWDKGKEACPMCGKPIDADKVEAMRQEFNTEKSNKLAEIKAAGEQASKEIIAAKEAAIVDAEKEIALITAKVIDIENKIAATNKELNNIPTQRIRPFDDTDEYKKLSDELNKAKSERLQIQNKVQSVASEAIRTQEAVIRDLSNELSALIKIKTDIDNADKLNDRIKELSDKEKKLAVDYEQIERGLYLCAEFIRAKVSMMTSAINKKFNRVRFRLFKEQINGGYMDDCEVLVPGQSGAFVPWGEGANTGAKINAGLEIIGVLSKYWGIALPVIIDNAEKAFRSGQI